MCQGHMAFFETPYFGNAPTLVFYPLKNLLLVSTTNKDTFCTTLFPNTKEQQYVLLLQGKNSTTIQVCSKTKGIGAFCIRCAQGWFPISRCLTLQHGLPQKFNLASFWVEHACWEGSISLSLHLLPPTQLWFTAALLAYIEHRID